MHYVRTVGWIIAVLCVWFVFNPGNDASIRPALILLLAFAIVLIKPGSIWKTGLYALALVGIAGISTLFLL